MARRRITTREEAQLREAALAARDDPGAVLERVEAQTRKSGTVVLSVRLPLEDAKRLRELAAARKESLSTLLTEAVESLVAGSHSRLSMTRGSQMIVYSGMGMSLTDTPGDEFEVVTRPSGDCVLTP